jgi:sulfate transporter 4
VISAVVSIFDLGEAFYLWKVHKLDCFTWVVSFLCTILFGVQIGLLSAVICSVLITLYESAYPHTAVLGRLPGSTVYRDVKQYPDAEQLPGIVVCRVDAPFYFANAQFIREVSFLTRPCIFVFWSIFNLINVLCPYFSFLAPIFLSETGKV